MHIYNITYQSSALSWLSCLLIYLCALRGSCLTILPFIFSDPKVSSLAQLIFGTFSYFLQMGIREWHKLRFPVYPEIYFFYFPRWQVSHLGMGYWLQSFLRGLWIWTSFTFWDFRWVWMLLWFFLLWKLLCMEA